MDAADDPEAVSRFAGRMHVESHRLTRWCRRSSTSPGSRSTTPCTSPSPSTSGRGRRGDRPLPPVGAEARDIERARRRDRAAGVRGRRPAHHRGRQPGRQRHQLPARTRVAAPVRRRREPGRDRRDRPGIGIPRRTGAHLRAVLPVDPARSRATGGTGLGLAIVKHVCRQPRRGVTRLELEGQGSTLHPAPARGPGPHENRSRRLSAATDLSRGSYGTSTSPARQGPSGDRPWTSRDVNDVRDARTLANVVSTSPDVRTSATATAIVGVSPTRRIPGASRLHGSLPGPCPTHTRDLPDDAHPGRRGRGVVLRPPVLPAAPGGLRRGGRRARAGRPRRVRPRRAPTSCCSTSCCPGCPAPRSAVSCATAGTCRSSCSPPRTARSTRWWASSSAPTTTSPSRTRRASCVARIRRRAAPPCRAGRAAAGRPLEAGPVRMDVERHVVTVAPTRSPARSRSSSCSSCCCATPAGCSPGCS